MKPFFYFTLAYLAAAILIMMVFRDEWSTLLLGIIIRSKVFFHLLQDWIIYGVVAAIVLVVTTGVQTIKSRLLTVAFSVMICALFPSAFSLVKTSMPYIIPFYADPYLADFDKWLHFGHDPWEIVNKVAPYLLNRSMVSSYILVWSIPALFFPIILAASDGDNSRIDRFLFLYVVAWVVIGNIFALAGMSVGPVFYDRLIGGERFVALTEHLQNKELTQSYSLGLQTSLWELYQEEAQAIGSGISAFPSVHISSTTVAVLYMIERSRWLVLPALLFLCYVFFIAVYSGFHYAIDGYFSIAVIAGLWGWQRRGMRAE